MAEPSPIWTAIDTADWQAGDFIREPEFRELLQNIQHLAENHVHAGGTADGGFVPASDPIYIMYIGPAVT